MAGENNADQRGEPENNQSVPPDDAVNSENELLSVGEDEDYEDLDRRLDQLHSCLDVLEQQNDDLRARLCDLLESNRQVRQELLTQFEQEPTNTQHKQKQ